MNREIKFRCWTKDEMLYEGWNGDFFATKEIIFRYDNVMQYTGLKDKNGKEIYEGDIVKCYDHPTGVESVTGEVYFKDGSFRVKWSMTTLGDFGTAWTEIIGNIYENPDLLNQGENVERSVATEDAK